MSLARYRDGNQPVRVRRRPHLEALEDRTLLSSGLASSGQIIEFLGPNLMLSFDGVARSVIFTTQNTPYSSYAVANFTLAVANFTLQNSRASPPVIVDGPATPFTVQPVINWGDGQQSSGTLESTGSGTLESTGSGTPESTGSGTLDAVGSHMYSAPGLYQTTLVLPLPNQSPVTFTGALIEVFGAITNSAGSFSGGGGGGFVFVNGPNQSVGSPGAPPPTPASSGTASAPPANTNDDGSPAASFQAILFSPAANTPIGPQATSPALRKGYFYPSVKVTPPNKASSQRPQESGTREESADVVDVIARQLRADFVFALLEFESAPERGAPESQAAAKSLDSSLPMDIFPEDSVPALVCLHSNSDLLSAGLPDDELERVTALALVGFTPVVIAPVAEALVQTNKQESDEDARSADRSALAVEALVLVVCLCMWPHRPRQEATFVID